MATSLLDLNQLIDERFVLLAVDTSEMVDLRCEVDDESWASDLRRSFSSATLAFCVRWYRRELM